METPFIKIHSGTKGGGISNSPVEKLEETCGQGVEVGKNKFFFYEVLLRRSHFSSHALCEMPLSLLGRGIAAFLLAQQPKIAKDFYGEISCHYNSTNKLF